MRTLTVPISDIEFNKFGFSSNSMSFSELLDIINRELLKSKLDKSIQLAQKYHLSKMSMDEITNEVKSVRNAKSSH